MYTGNLLKMRTELNEPVQYYLHLGNEEIKLNDLIGKEFRIQYLNQINCIKCGKPTKTSFAQGYCYPCFISAPETEECVLRPELCRAHEGIARDMEYAKKFCLNDHIVYLAISSGLKVGVTRISQVPTRWIDQGAWKAIKLAITPNRYLAGCIEVELKSFINDKTNWRNMLKNNIPENINLKVEKEKTTFMLSHELRKYTTKDDSILEMHYPVKHYPEKVKSLNLEKVPFIEDILLGVKGQYLLFESGAVFNVRKHNGYLVNIDIQ